MNNQIRLRLIRIVNQITGMPKIHTHKHIEQTIYLRVRVGSISNNVYKAKNIVAINESDIIWIKAIKNMNEIFESVLIIFSQNIVLELLRRISIFFIKFNQFNFSYLINYFHILIRLELRTSIQNINDGKLIFEDFIKVSNEESNGKIWLSKINK